MAAALPTDSGLLRQDPPPSRDINQPTGRLGGDRGEKIKRKKDFVKSHAHERGEDEGPRRTESDVKALPGAIISVVFGKEIPVWAREHLISPDRIFI